MPAARSRRQQLGGPESSSFVGKQRSCTVVCLANSLGPLEIIKNRVLGSMQKYENDNMHIIGSSSAGTVYSILFSGISYLAQKEPGCQQSNSGSKESNQNGGERLNEIGHNIQRVLQCSEQDGLECQIEERDDERDLFCSHIYCIPWIWIHGQGI